MGAVEPRESKVSALGEVASFVGAGVMGGEVRATEENISGKEREAQRYGAKTGERACEKVA